MPTVLVEGVVELQQQGLSGEKQFSGHDVE